MTRFSFMGTDSSSPSSVDCYVDFEPSFGVNLADLEMGQKGKDFSFNKIYSELIKLLTPSAVVNSTIFKSNEKIKSKDFYSCSLLLFFYILMFVIYSFILTLENIKFDDSFLTAVLLTFNTLPSNIFVSEDINFTNFSNLTMIFTCIMLILSKVTPLSIIALVKYRFLK